METIKGVIDAKKVSTGVSKAGKSWTRTEFTINGKKYNTFHEMDYDEGEAVQVTFEKEGNFNNIKSAILLNRPNTTEEKVENVVQSKPVGTVDNRQEAITLGQAANLAYDHIKLMGGITDEEYDKAFKEQTKRYFRLLRETQNELIR